MGTDAGSHLNATLFDPETGVQSFVTYERWIGVIADVKAYVNRTATLMIGELQRRFPENHVMNATSIVYPQFWLKADWEELLPTNMQILKEAFGKEKEVLGEDGTVEKVARALCITKLDVQLDLFSTSKIHNLEAAMHPIDEHIHPLTKVWRRLSQNPVLLKSFSEYFKLAEIAMVQDALASCT